jgi:protein involved in polysaccharide export with SLBB domain
MQISLPINMKRLRSYTFGLWFCSSLLLVVGLSGCSTPNPTGAVDEPTATKAPDLARITVGDTVTVTLTGIDDLPPAQLKPLKEDGTITLPDIGKVQAAGKTPGELEDIIHDLYVPKVYTHLNVTVILSSDRVYFVRGEVKAPNRVLYTGPVTVTKAITSAGDFTDFADHKNIVLIRSNGKHYKLNCDRILRGDDPDPPVYPGDQIEVNRRTW